MSPSISTTIPPPPRRSSSSGPDATTCPAWRITALSATRSTSSSTCELEHDGDAELVPTRRISRSIVSLGRVEPLGVRRAGPGRGRGRWPVRASPAGADPSTSSRSAGPAPRRGSPARGRRWLVRWPRGAGARGAPRCGGRSRPPARPGEASGVRARSRPAPDVRTGRPGVQAEDRQLALLGRVEAEQQAQQGRLAGAVRAEQACDPRGDLHRRPGPGRAYEPQCFTTSTACTTGAGAAPSTWVAWRKVMGW